MMRAEFLKSMQAVPDEQPEWEPFTQIIPSTARIETYAWMTPSPGISRYLGHRREVMLDQIKYVVANVEYDGGMNVSTRDVEDDQIGGYQLRMKEEGEKARIFPGIAVLRDALANGASLPCFDGTNFFATTHTIGSYPSSVPSGFGGGGNALTFTSSNTSDSASNTMIFLVHNKPLKPLLWQNRKGPIVGTDAGSPQSLKDKKASYWVDLEGAPAFGYWWDALRVVITNTPSLTDMFTCMDAALRTLFQFSLPAALPTDPVLYMHQGLKVSPKNVTIVCSTGLWALLRHALGEERIGVSVAGSTSGLSNNIYYSMFNLVQTPYLN